MSRRPYRERHGSWWAVQVELPRDREAIRRMVFDNPEATARLVRAIERAPLVPEYLIDRAVKTWTNTNDPKPLTQIEVAVVEAASRGLADKEIALELDKSVWTVKRQMQAILMKMRARNRTAACVMAVRRGLI